MLTKDSIKRIAQSVDIKSDDQIFYEDTENSTKSLYSHVKNIHEFAKKAAHAAVDEYLFNVFGDPQLIEDPYLKAFIEDLMAVVDNEAIPLEGSGKLFLMDVDV